jgi:hypothetical protein
MSEVSVAERKAQVAEIFSGYKAKAFTEVLDISARELKAMLASPENKVTCISIAHSPIDSRRELGTIRGVRVFFLLVHTHAKCGSTQIMLGR